MAPKIMIRQPNHNQTYEIRVTQLSSASEGVGSSTSAYSASGVPLPLPLPSGDVSTDFSLPSDADTESTRHHEPANPAHINLGPLHNGVPELRQQPETAQQSPEAAQQQPYEEWFKDQVEKTAQEAIRGSLPRKLIDDVHDVILGNLDYRPKLMPASVLA